MSIVSQNIKYLRRMNGLTQEQFARRIGIKRSLVGAYEEARANPPLDKLKVIAGSFNISVDSLIKHDIRKVRETPDMALAFEKAGGVQPLKNVAAEFLSKIQPTTHAPAPRPSVFESNRPETRSVPDSSSGMQLNRNPEPASPLPRNAELPTSSIRNAFVVIHLNQQVPYINNIHNGQFISGLPTYNLPQFQGEQLRGFELGNDFVIKNAIVVANAFKNINRVVDGTAYILVTKSSGIIYRRVYNQLQLKNKLLLSSDVPNILSQEITENDMLELWEVKGYITTEIPKPNPSLEKIERFIADAASELERLKNRIS